MQRWSQYGKIVPLLSSMLLQLACSAAPDTRPDARLPPSSTTQGTTLVRMATVINVQQLQANQSSPVQQVTVQFDDGRVGRYEFGNALNIQVGDRVKVSDTHGQIRILP